MSSIFEQPTSFTCSKRMRVSPTTSPVLCTKSKPWQSWNHGTCLWKTSLISPRKWPFQSSRPCLDTQTCVQVEQATPGGGSFKPRRTEVIILFLLLFVLSLPLLSLVSLSWLFFFTFLYFISFSLSLTPLFSLSFSVSLALSRSLSLSLSLSRLSLSLPLSPFSYSFSYSFPLSCSSFSSSSCSSFSCSSSSFSSFSSFSLSLRVAGVARKVPHGASQERWPFPEKFAHAYFVEACRGQYNAFCGQHGRESAASLHAVCCDMCFFLRECCHGMPTLHLLSTLCSRIQPLGRCER